MLDNRDLSVALVCAFFARLLMVDATAYPTEDASNIDWFNQMMDEHFSLLCYHNLKALQEMTDAHLIWSSDEAD